MLSGVSVINVSLAPAVYNGKVLVNGVAAGTDAQYAAAWGAQSLNMFGIGYMGQVGNEIHGKINSRTNN